MMTKIFFTLLIWMRVSVETILAQRFLVVFSLSVLLFLAVLPLHPTQCTQSANTEKENTAH